MKDFRFKFWSDIDESCKLEYNFWSLVHKVWDLSRGKGATSVLCWISVDVFVCLICYIHFIGLQALCNKVCAFQSERTSSIMWIWFISVTLLDLLLLFRVRINFRTPQLLHPSPLSQAGGLDRLQDRSGSAASQSWVRGGQRPLVGKTKKQICHTDVALNLPPTTWVADTATWWTLRKTHYTALYHIWHQICIWKKMYWYLHE